MEEHNKTVQAAMSALLHDFGKIAYRAGEPGRHSESGYRILKSIIPDEEIQNGIRYHHARQLKQAKLPADSVAYLVYIADNIASAADRREIDKEEGEEDGAIYRRDLPLTSVFRHMNGCSKTYTLPLRSLTMEYPKPKIQGTLHGSPSGYSTIMQEMLTGLKGMQWNSKWVNSLLSLTEAWESFVPSSTDVRQSADISLFDHQKITAAVAACINEYLLEQGESDYCSRLFKKESEFKKEKAFLLYSADVSGIQNFIYTIAEKNALKSMRSRSFFLELLMEHYIDELLERCGLSRANLLYSGGGHCYMLLPNTTDTIGQITKHNCQFNAWLRKNFGIRLYIADGYTECSANELTNEPREEAPYPEMFRRVSRAISQRKLQRYSPAELMELNCGHVLEDGRECKICGATDHLVGEKCEWCQTFERMSEFIQNKDVYVISTQPFSEQDIPLPHKEGEIYLSLTDVSGARNRLKCEDDILRVYTKNEMYTGLSYATRLYIGDYHNSNRMDELIQSAQGITRLATCRMDVDDLGRAFVSGFEQKDAGTKEEQYQYVTISRTAAFSRQMSLFFKYYINEILKGKALTIVYSGGDDVFLVGAWDHILQAAQDIQRSLTEFTCGTLHLSAGLLVHTVGFPIRRAASQAAELEDKAKDRDGKNAVCLFEAEDDAQTYSWAEFETKVMREKVSLLERFFASQPETDGRGKAFLYRLLDLLRNSNERINLARFAYLLARMEPKKDSKAYPLYAEFSKTMYQWYRDDTERRQLITAIMIYVYLTREADER